MKKLLIVSLALTALLAGCGEKPDVSPPPPEEIPPASVENIPVVLPSDDVQPPEETGREVWLEWEGESEGEWPFVQRLELLQFCGSELPELEEANRNMRETIENQRYWFEVAREKGEEQCRADGDAWASLWAYPVETDRYLSAILIQRNVYLHADDTRTWNIVGANYAYDKQEQKLLSLEDALGMMEIDQGYLEGEIWEFAGRQNIGTYEDLSSIGFYMAPEGHPVFIIGGIVRGAEDAYGWPTFFNWDKGEIRWPDDEPMPLSLVDTRWEELACLQGMGQYDGAAIISEEEAFDMLCEIVEIQDALLAGMSLMSDDTTECIDGEEYVCIALGTEHDENFVREQLYAVSWYSVFRMDPMTGDWVIVGFG